MAYLKGALVAAAVALAVAVLNVLAKQHQHPPLLSLAELKLTCEDRPDLCSVPSGSSSRAPNRLTKSGRWTQAALSPNIGDETAVQFKRWIYVSFVSDRVFVACAMVKFSYISDVFLYVVDRETRAQYEYKARLPLGVGLSQYMFSSVANCTKWGIPQADFNNNNNKPWIEYCARPTGGYRFRAHVPVERKNNNEEGAQGMEWVAMDITTHSGMDLVLAYPLAGDESRLAYVHKLAGMAVPAASGSFVRIGDDSTSRLSMDHAAGALDWTKGRMLYRTAWRWVSFNDPKATVNGKPVLFGINLSSGVYDVQLQNGGGVVSAENAVWIDGQMIPLTMPVEITPGPKLWRIKTVGNSEVEQVDLEFTVWGAREDHSDFGVVVSDFVQPFGEFTGTVRVRSTTTVQLSSKVFGVVEDHLAYW